MLDNLAEVLSSVSEEAILGNARQRLFAAIVQMSEPNQRQAALAQVYNARFLMASLISPANWVLSAGEPALARRFLEKAPEFSDIPAQLMAIPSS